MWNSVYIYIYIYICIYIYIYIYIFKIERSTKGFVFLYLFILFLHTCYISLVGSLRKQDIMTCSLLDFLKAGLHSPKVGWIWKPCWHFAWGNLLILGLKSVYGILNLLGIISKADLAAEPALSFPLALIWLGIKHVRVSLQFDIESSLLNSEIIRGFSIFFIT